MSEEELEHLRELGEYLEEQAAQLDHLSDSDAIEVYLTKRDMAFILDCIDAELDAEDEDIYFQDYDDDSL